MYSAIFFMFDGRRPKYEQIFSVSLIGPIDAINTSFGAAKTHFLQTFQVNSDQVDHREDPLLTKHIQI